MQDKLRASLRDVRIPAAIISLFLSAWSVFLDDVVNNDGVLYLHSADLISRGEWQAAFGLYKWPFYSLLIALTAQVTGLGLEYAAHLLNAVLTALAVICFISLVGELGGDRKTVLAAAFVVLLYPGINEYRSFIIRDAGYIAFYLFSLLFFVKNFKSPRWKYAASWGSSMFVAGLFRIEGFVFLLMLPLLEQWRKVTTVPARLMLLTTMTVAWFVLALIMAWWLYGITIALSPAKIVHEVTTLLQGVWQNIIANVSAKVGVIAEQFLNEYSRDHAYAVYFSALGTILLVEMLDTLTLLYAFLTGHAIYRKLIFPVEGIKRVWTWLVLLNLAILSVVVAVKLFLTGRFPLAISLTLILAVPFSVVALYEKWRENRSSQKTKNWLFPVVCAVFLISGVEGLYSPTTKGHLREAGVWLKENTSAKSSLFSNNAMVIFYSGKDAYSSDGTYSWNRTLEVINSKRWRDYDYLAFRIKRAESERASALLQALGKDPIMELQNRKGDKVLIFKVH